MKVKLGEYIQEYSVRNKANEDIPVYSVTNTQGFCQDYFGKEVASKDKSTYKIVPRGYFAYNPSRINVGSVDWQRDEDQVIVSPLYNVFSVSPELNQQYLYYYLKSDFALHRIKAVATGSVRDNLKLEMLKNFPIRIPRVEEQEYIVQVLDKAKNIINLRRNELQKLDDLIKARFVEMFGDNQEVHKLSDIAAITGGLTKNSRRDKLELRKPYLRVANVFFASIDTTEILDIGLTKEEYEKTLLRNGDLLFVEGNGSPDQIGRVAIWNGEIEDCVHQNHLIKARFDLKRMNPVFAMYYFISERGRNQIKKRAVSTSGLYTLSVSKIADFEIPNPPMELQQQFAAFVAAIDKSKLLSGCRLFHSWAPENRDKPKHVGVPQRKTKVLRGGRRQQ